MLTGLFNLRICITTAGDNLSYAFVLAFDNATDMPNLLSCDGVRRIYEEGYSSSPSLMQSVMFSIVRYFQSCNSTCCWTVGLRGSVQFSAAAQWISPLRTSCASASQSGRCHLRNLSKTSQLTIIFSAICRPLLQLAKLISVSKWPLQTSMCKLFAPNSLR